MEEFMSYPRIYVGPEENSSNAEPAAAPTALRAVHWKRIDVRRLIDEVLQTLAARMKGQSVEADIDVPQTHFVSADSEMLRRCVLGLTLHALDAMPSGGELSITSYIGPHGFELEIADSGQSDSASFRSDLRGVPAASTTRLRSGDIALAYRLIAAHGGYISARNCADGGTARTIQIPHHAMEAAA